MNLQVCTLLTSERTISANVKLQNFLANFWSIFFKILFPIFYFTDQWKVNLRMLRMVLNLWRLPWLNIFWMYVSLSGTESHIHILHPLKYIIYLHNR